MFDFFVVIPCYNNLSGLKRSLASISYDPCRYGLLIIDDASLEPLSLTDLKGSVSHLVFIKIIRLKTNSGITTALNTGLEWLSNRSDFRFIARLDCGDICALHRFTRQVGYLMDHPEIDLVSSWVRFQDLSGKISYLYRTPVDPVNIEKGMHFRNLFIHPAIMWRAVMNGIVGNYPEDLPYAEDYGFVYKILRHGKAAILAEELVVCELNREGISFRHRRKQLRSRIKTVLRYKSNWLLAFLGVIKLGILLLTPQKVILAIKSCV